MVHMVHIALLKPCIEAFAFVMFLHSFIQDLYLICHLSVSAASLLEHISKG